LLDVSLDADSELICAVEVLPANGDEAANATQLIASEEHVHGNDIASLSVDRIGYRGDVLAELSEATDGPQLTVYVPPIDWLPPTPELFQPTDFTLTQAGNELHCPGGATTSTRQRAKRGHGWKLVLSQTLDEDERNYHFWLPTQLRHKTAPLAIGTRSLWSPAAPCEWRA
jgi:hypothetical protein